jgi:putative flippase GtrA
MLGRMSIVDRATAPGPAHRTVALVGGAPPERALVTRTGGRFSRFLAAGAAASAVYLGGFALLLALGAHYLAAGAVALIAAIALGFVLNGAWTFGFGRGPMARQALSFAAVQLAVGAGTLALLHLLVTSGIDQVLLAQLLAAGMMAPANYLASGRWGFR